MLVKLEKHINVKFPFLKDKKILVAISGGIDSVVLTQLFSILNFDISLAHCNFKLRGEESDLDEGFVCNFAKNNNKNYFTTSFNTKEFAQKNKQSMQVAARNLRYSWFQEVMRENCFDFLLTAHHADDNLETFLINLTRGSGLNGFTGIPEINENIIRPLLIFSRDEIIKYAKDSKIVWREDKSNSSTKYIRNKIRHKVVPVLKDINPGLLETFSKTIENLDGSKQIINDRVLDISSDILFKTKLDSLEIIKIAILEINKLSNPKAYLYQLLKQYNFTEFNDIFNLLTSQSGKQIFSKTHAVLKDRDFLILSEIKEKKTSDIYYIEQNKSEIRNPFHLKIEETLESSLENKSIIYISKDKLIFPLIIRRWKNGDFFYPVGMNGKKKISKYFKDEKLSLLQKEQAWLLCNNDDDIIWLIDRRQDNRFCALKENTNAIKISLI